MQCFHLIMATSKLFFRKKKTILLYLKKKYLIYEKYEKRNISKYCFRIFNQITERFKKYSIFFNVCLILFPHIYNETIYIITRETEFLSKYMHKHIASFKYITHCTLSLKYHLFLIPWSKAKWNIYTPACKFEVHFCYKWFNNVWIFQIQCFLWTRGTSKT